MPCRSYKYVPRLSLCLHIVPVCPDGVYALPSRMDTIVDSANFPDDVPVAVGYTLSIFLYGILIVQSFIYYTRFTKDSKWIRFYVLFIFVCWRLLVPG
ncbi:hypothetical protein OG21DRAFT_641128 [Imleria badia]|nr:hypothetical protein OG21DRAFT_641128 [Imleria badia]